MKAAEKEKWIKLIRSSKFKTCESQIKDDPDYHCIGHERMRQMKYDWDEIYPLFRSFWETEGGWQTDKGAAHEAFLAGIEVAERRIREGKPFLTSEDEND